VKKIHLFLILIFLGIFNSIQASSLSVVGKLQLRYEGRDKTYNDLGELYLKEDQIRYSDYAFGGRLGLKASLYDFDIQALGYGVARLHEKNENILKNEKQLYNNDLDGFLYLGELSISKQFAQHIFSLGRQRYKSYLVDENFRLTNNAYEGVSYKYKNSNLNIKALYFHKVASSTLANAVPFNHKYGFLGYGLGYNSGGYTSLSEHLINKDLSTNGALHFELKYGEENSFISLENLYIDNFFNTSNLTLSYGISSFYGKIGMLYQFSVGKKYMEKYIEDSEQGKKLEAKHYQTELGYKKERFKLNYLFTYTPYNTDAIYNGTLYSPFSNHASWLRGLNSSHALISDTSSHKIGFENLFHISKLPLALSTGYAIYDIKNNNGLSPKPLDTSEFYFHTKAYFSKHLSAKVQYSYMKEFDPLTELTQNVKVAVEYKF